MLTRKVWYVADSLWPPFVMPAACGMCPLRKKAKVFVPGYGNLKARLVVVAEKPGPEEVRKGRPMVGKTGERIADALGYGRNASALDEAVFRTNVRRCHCPTETPKEKVESIEYCARTYLVPELAALGEARTVLAVGADAAGVLVGKWETAEARKNLMAKLHGTVWTRKEVDNMRWEKRHAKTIRIRVAPSSLATDCVIEGLMDLRDGDGSDNG